MIYLLFFKFDTTLSSPIEYIFIVLSFPPDAINFPLGKKLIDLTGEE